jgi:hypothetical protein
MRRRFDFDLDLGLVPILPVPLKMHGIEKAGD